MHYLLYYMALISAFAVGVSLFNDNLSINMMYLIPFLFSYIYLF